MILRYHSISLFLLRLIWNYYIKKSIILQVTNTRSIANFPSFSHRRDFSKLWLMERIPERFYLQTSNISNPQSKKVVLLQKSHQRLENSIFSIYFGLTILWFLRFFVSVHFRSTLYRNFGGTCTTLYISYFWRFSSHSTEQTSNF